MVNTSLSSKTVPNSQSSSLSSSSLSGAMATKAPMKTTVAGKKTPHHFAIAYGAKKRRRSSRSDDDEDGSLSEASEDSETQESEDDQHQQHHPRGLLLYQYHYQPPSSPSSSSSSSSSRGHRKDRLHGHDSESESDEEYSSGSSDEYSSDEYSSDDTSQGPSSLSQKRVPSGAMAAMGPSTPLKTPRKRLAAVKSPAVKCPRSAAKRVALPPRSSSSSPSPSSSSPIATTISSITTTEAAMLDARKRTRQSAAVAPLSSSRATSSTSVSGSVSTRTRTRTTRKRTTTTAAPVRGRRAATARRGAATDSVIDSTKRSRTKRKAQVQRRQHEYSTRPFDLDRRVNDWLASERNTEHHTFVADAESNLRIKLEKLERRQRNIQRKIENTHSAATSRQQKQQTVPMAQSVSDFRLEYSLDTSASDPAGLHAGKVLLNQHGLPVGSISGVSRSRQQELQLQAQNAMAAASSMAGVFSPMMTDPSLMAFYAQYYQQYMQAMSAAGGAASTNMQQPPPPPFFMPPGGMDPSMMAHGFMPPFMPPAAAAAAGFNHMGMFPPGFAAHGSPMGGKKKKKKKSKKMKKSKLFQMAAAKASAKMMEMSLSGAPLQQQQPASQSSHQLQAEKTQKNEEGAILSTSPPTEDTQEEPSQTMQTKDDSSKGRAENEIDSNEKVETKDDVAGASYSPRETESVVAGESIQEQATRDQEKNSEGMNAVETMATDSEDDVIVDQGTEFGGTNDRGPMVSDDELPPSILSDTDHAPLKKDPEKPRTVPITDNSVRDDLALLQSDGSEMADITQPEILETGEVTATVDVEMENVQSVGDIINDKEEEAHEHHVIQEEAGAEHEKNSTASYIADLDQVQENDPTAPTLEKDVSLSASFHHHTDIMEDIFEASTLEMDTHQHLESIIGINRASEIYRKWKRETRKQRRTSFRGQLLGRDDGEYYAPLFSLFSLKHVDPFIARDLSTFSPKMKLLSELMVFHYGDEDYRRYYRVGSIDYCRMQPWHADQINHMLSRHYWPNIDISCFNDYPDYTVIVLYKRLIVGCAFMIPTQNYIPFFCMHPEWMDCGISNYMLFFLIRDHLDSADEDAKDITTHVSANNSLMISLFEKFGFQQEQFHSNFYQRYFYQDDSDRDAADSSQNMSDTLLIDSPTSPVHVGTPPRTHSQSHPSLPSHSTTIEATRTPTKSHLYQPPSTPDSAMRRRFAQHTPRAKTPSSVKKTPLKISVTPKHQLEHQISYTKDNHSKEKRQRRKNFMSKHAQFLRLKLSRSSVAAAAMRVTVPDQQHGPPIMM